MSVRDPYVIDTSVLPDPVPTTRCRGAPPRAQRQFPDAAHALAEAKKIILDSEVRLRGDRAPNMARMVRWDSPTQGEIVPALVDEEIERASTAPLGRAKELKKHSRLTYDLLSFYHTKKRLAEPEVVTALMHVFGLADLVERRLLAERLLQCEAKCLVTTGRRPLTSELAAKLRKSERWVQLLRRHAGVKQRGKLLEEFFSRPGVIERSRGDRDDGYPPFAEEFHDAIPPEWAGFDEVTARRAIAAFSCGDAVARRTGKMVVYRMIQREADGGHTPSTLLMHAVFLGLGIPRVRVSDDFG
jgi:hypothetical protein